MYFFQKKNFKTLCSIFLIFSLSSFCHAATTSAQELNQEISGIDQELLKSNYNVEFSLPANWEELPTSMDDTGYKKSFAPKAKPRAERISLQFIRNNKSNLKELVLRLVREEKASGCDVKTNVKEAADDFITFVIDRAPCGVLPKSLQVYKVFKTSDGVYSLSYTALVEHVPSKTLENMTQVIQSAKIVKK